MRPYHRSNRIEVGELKRELRVRIGCFIRDRSNHTVAVFNLKQALKFELFNPMTKAVVENPAKKPQDGTESQTTIEPRFSFQ